MFCQMGRTRYSFFPNSSKVEHGLTFFVGLVGHKIDHKTKLTGDRQTDKPSDIVIYTVA